MRNLLSALTVMALLTGSFNIRADDDHLRAKDLVDSGEILPLDKIMQKAFADRQWRLLEAELEKEHGRYIYELEILDDKGNVRKLKYDAKDGQPISGKDK
jgi:uncharacterized membrane protein YkoI